MSPTQTHLTSATLVHALRIRDDDAWHRFVVLYGPFIEGWIRRYDLNNEAIEDISQDVMTAVAASFDRFKHQPEKKGSLRAWLYGVTRNKLSDWFARNRTNPISPGGTDAQIRMQQVPEFEPESDELTALKSRKQLALRALGLLESDFEDRTWKAFWKTVIENESTAAVATTLGMTSKAVRQARYRVLKHLRNELGDQLSVLT
ncbi:MAG: RNA polymerase sigma factor [Planctomycetaceae bacterium]